MVRRQRESKQAFWWGLARIVAVALVLNWGFKKMLSIDLRVVVVSFSAFQAFAPAV